MGEARKVVDLGLAKEDGPLFFIKDGAVYGMKPGKSPHRVRDLPVEQESGYRYYVKGGELWRQKRKGAGRSKDKHEKQEEIEEETEEEIEEEMENPGKDKGSSTALLLIGAALAAILFLPGLLKPRK